MFQLNMAGKVGEMHREGTNAKQTMDIETYRTHWPSGQLV